MQLTNKKILITGATNGIGLELAKKFTNLGAQIIALGKNIKKLDKLYQDVLNQKESNPKILEPVLIPCNLAGASPKDYLEIAQQISKEFGGLDTLIHNAASLGMKTEIIHYDPIKWHETIQVNINSVFMLTQALLPLLKLSNNANIIFTVANEASTGTAYQGAYGISKAAIKNFMEILAEELDSYTNIRVNAINPNKIYSGIYKNNYPGCDPSSLKKPKDIVPLYLEILTNKNLAKSGETLVFAA